MQWTQAAVDDAIKLAGDGHTEKAIAAALSARFERPVSRAAVNRILGRHDEAHAARRAARSADVSDRHGRIRSLARAGLSARQIGARLGESVNAIYKAVPRAERVEPQHLGPASLAGWLARCAREAVPPDPVTAAGKTFFERGERECAWPIGVDDEGHARFCAAPKSQHRSYCAAHHQQSIRSQP